MKHILLLLMVVLLGACSGNVEEKLDGRWFCEPIGWNVDAQRSMRITFNYQTKRVNIERKFGFQDLTGTYKISGMFEPLLEIDYKRDKSKYKIIDFPRPSIFQMKTEGVLPEITFECLKRN